MGLLAILLAGIALFLARSETVQLTARSIADAVQGPQLRFETSHKQPKTFGGDAYAIGQRANPRDPIILTGFPAYQGAAFYLPSDARPTSGHLQLDVTVQALAGVEGVLRVSIGNTRRAELLLRPGEAGRSLRIDLTQDDLARERLVVSFSLQGEGPHTPCGIDAGLETVVEIETTSALFLVLNETVLSIRDRADLAGRQVLLRWSDDPTDRATAIVAALALDASAWEVLFAQYAVGLDPMAALHALTTASPLPRSKYAWSEALSPHKGLFGLRRFKRAQTWRIRYDMTDAVDPRLPKFLSLDMALGQLPGSAQWQVSVTLNGRLVDQALLPAGTTVLARDIDLSAALHARHNAIEIVAASTADAQGECNAGPDLLAEITTRTALIAGPDSFNDPLFDLRQALARSKGWHLAVDDGLTSPEATVSVALLSAVLPGAAPPNSTSKGPRLHILPRAAPVRQWRHSSADKVWLVSLDDDGRVIVRILAGHPEKLTRAVTLLVDFSEVAI